MVARGFVGIAGALGALLGSGCAFEQAAGEAPGVARRPNVVLLVSDDHRADVLGCAGHRVVRTPHLDRLAARGVRFANAFVTTPICAASRASILLGMHERRHGYTFRTPPVRADLAARSYPVLLRRAGYVTGFVGKLGVRTEPGWVEEAFDRCDVLHMPYRKTLPDGLQRHLTDLIGDRAIEFLRSTPAGRPFCLSVSFNAGHAQDGDLDDHYPSAPAEAGIYDGVPMPRPSLDGGEVFAALPPFLRASMNRIRYHWRWDTPEKYERNLRGYFALLTGMDRVIGRITAELAALGVEGDTVVLFCGDNGYYMGERGLAGKWSHFDESLRVPMIVYDPRAPVSARGRVRAEMALNVDLAPTVLDYCGIAVPSAVTGRSLRSLVAGQTVRSWRRQFYCEHRFDHADIPKWEGVRGEQWMYARYFEQGAEGEFLHDLRRDPRQLRNLAGATQSAAVLAELRERTAAMGRELAAR